MQHLPEKGSSVGLSGYEALVIGVSAGGLKALDRLLPLLPADFPLAVAVVQHLRPECDNYQVRYFSSRCRLPVREAQEKEEVTPGVIYFAPPDYHLLVERDKTFSLARDARVSYSRPSIDVLFESAAAAYGRKLIGIIMTGANADGAEGLQRIKHYGGLAIVQAPDDAEASFMPQAAIEATETDHIATVEGIARLLGAETG